MTISTSSLRRKVFAGLLLAIGLSVSTRPLAANDAAMIQISKSTGQNTTLMPSPPDLVVKKNTMVIWLNAIPGEEIQVAFKDGKACRNAAYSPASRGFSLNATSCFVTNFIPFSQTSSLLFKQTGTFAYSLTDLTGRLSGKGRIIVQ